MILFVLLALQPLLLCLGASAKPIDPSIMDLNFNDTVTVDGLSDFSDCEISTRSNPWQNLPISPTPFPDPSVDQVARNSTIVNGYENPLCVQIARYRFSNVFGYVRTRPIEIVDGSSTYWLVWTTTYPAKAVVWRSQGAIGPYWTKIYTSPNDGEAKGAVRLTGGSINNRMMADLGLPEGAGRGTRGEIALFRLDYPSTPAFE